MVKGWRIFLLLVLLWFCSAGIAAALKVKAITGRDQIADGESLQLQLRLDGNPDAEADFSPLKKDWEILGRSQSVQRRLVNGNYSSSVVYNLTLMPRGKGPLVIPPVCFGKVCSQPVTVRVVARSSLPVPANEQVFLETSVSSQKIVVQGQLLFKVRLLIRGGLPEGKLSEPQPTGVRVQVKKLNDVRKYEKRSNGLVYQVFERTYAIFPQESGQMLIPALQFDGLIAGGRTRLDPFARQGMQVRRSSQLQQIEVTPFPPDRGNRPWLPSTGVVLQDDWQEKRPELVVGEPITRTLRLTAVGVLSAQLPELIPNTPESFKVYPDQPRREDELVSGGIKGVLVQKIALIPTRAGRFQFPAYDLDWWDISRGQWRKAHLAALEVEVAPAPEQFVTTPKVAQTGPAKTPEKVETTPAIPAGNSPVSVPVKTEPRFDFWPWLSLGLLLGWMVTLVIFWRGRRSRDFTAKVESGEIPVDEKKARQVLLQAARNNDPQATRQALVRWSRLLWPDAGASSYERLKEIDPELRQQLERLDQQLYGNTDSAWQGQELAFRIAAWKQQEATDKKIGLPDLYP